MRFLQWALPQLHMRWPGYCKVRRQMHAAGPNGERSESILPPATINAEDVSVRVDSLARNEMSCWRII